MRESCSCGAAIHTLYYRRAITWRSTHRCNTEPNELVDLSDPTGIGFAPNPAEEWEEN